MSREARVLVFVHDATDGEMVDMQMRKAHVRCTVQRVTQKDQFLKAMRTMPPDLAIVDGAYPRIDMASVVKTALQTAPGTPWIVLSTSQAEDALVSWMKAGAADVVTRKNYARLGTVASELLAQKLAAQVPGGSHPTPAAMPGQRMPSPGPASPTHGSGAPATPGNVPGGPARAAGATPQPQRPAPPRPGATPGEVHAAPPRPAAPSSAPPPRPPSGVPAPPAGTASSVPLDAFGEPIVPSTREAIPPVPLPPDGVPKAPPAPVPGPAVSPLPSQAEARLHEQQVFREIVEHAGDLIFVLDAQGKRLYSNPAHAQVLDTPDRLQGTVAFVDVHPDDRLTVSDAFREAIKEGKETRIEYRLMDKKGFVRVMESLGTVVASPAGESRAVVVSRDVTDRVQQEQDREALLRALGPLTGERYFHNLVYVLADTLKVRYVLVSESLYQPYERVRSVAYWANGMLMPSFEYDLADTTCDAVYSTRGPVHYPDSVQELFPRETALVEMEARSYLGVPLIGSDSAIVGHLFVMDDKRMADPSRALHMLTQTAGRTATEVERLHQERILGGAESRLRFMLESLADGVLATDTLEIITYLSEQVGALVGCSSVDMIGKPLMQFIELPDAVQEGASLTEGEVRVRLRCADGTARSAVLRAKTLKDSAGKAMGTVFLVHPIAD